MKLVVLLMLTIVFFGGCSGSSSNSKSDKNHHKIRPEESLRVKLQNTRERLVKNEFNEMKEEIKKVMLAYHQYQSLARNLENHTGADYDELARVDREFMNNHGAKAIELRELFNQLKDNFDNKKQQAAIKKIELQNHRLVFEQKVVLFNECRADVERQRNNLQSRKQVAQAELNQYRENINSIRRRIDRALDCRASNVRRANRSNWAPDKRKYRERANDCAKEAERLGSRASGIANNANNRSRVLQSELNQLKSTAELKIEECTQIANAANEVKESIEEQSSFLETLISELNSIKNEIEQKREENAGFYAQYAAYTLRRNEITDNAQQRIDTAADRFQELQDEVIFKFGVDYLLTYEKTKSWLESPRLEPRTTRELLLFLESRAASTTHLLPIFNKIKEITLMAAGNLVVDCYFNPNRVVASVLSDFTGVDIDLSNIRVPDIRMPNLNINNFNINIPDIRIPNVDINLPDLNIAEINFNDFDLRLDSLNIDIPVIEVVRIEARVDGDFNRFLSHFEDIRLPNIQIAHFKSDVTHDITNPGSIHQNTNRELTRAKRDLDRELTHAYRNLRRESNTAIRNTQREVGNGLRKTGKALEAAGQPKNLARIAIVYAASVYGGPLGSALANSLLDKLENPGMSEQQMFNSFLIGAAAGYATEAVAGTPIDSIQSMPGAASAITRNLTTDVGEIILNGRSYTSQDLLVSLATGAANINSGDTFVAEVVNSTLNSATSYSLDTAIRQENFNMDHFENAVYSGLANGVTRESVQALMDEYVVPHIARRQDLQLIESIKKVLTDVFTGHQESILEEQVSILNSLNESERDLLTRAANEQNQAFFEFLKNHPHISFNELILTNADSARLAELYDEFVASYATTDTYNQAAEMLAVKSQAEGRNPAFVRALIMTAISAYGYYMSVENAMELKTRYETSGQTPEEFLRDNPFDVAMLGADMALTVAPVLRIVGNPRLAGQIVSSAQNFGIRTIEEINDFTDTFRIIVKNNIGAIGNIDEIVEVTSLISRKTNFILGRATGSPHNIERSQSMLRQMERIGLFDTPQTREIIKDNLITTLSNPGTIRDTTLEGGRILRESLISGSNGHLKIESIWDGRRLITVKLKGGR